jgi:hypothetical protein
MLRIGGDVLATWTPVPIVRYATGGFTDRVREREKE